MLRKNYLFELIKSLDIHEKRYLMDKGKRAGLDLGYIKIIHDIYKLDKYNEQDVQKIISECSISSKTEVKKHYLYYWILKHLYDFHSDQYKRFKDLSYVFMLKDKALYAQALALIPDIKKDLIEGERYPELFILLENELRLCRYIEQLDSETVLNELVAFSKQFNDYSIYETLKNQFRKKIDVNMFARSEADIISLNRIMSHPYLSKKYKTEGILNKYNFYLLNYWASAHVNNWDKAYEYARLNYRHMSSSISIIKKFPEQFLFVTYNLLNAQSINGLRQSSTALKDIDKLIISGPNKRVRNDAAFFLHLSKLIKQNKHSTNSVEKDLEAAERFIIKNGADFSRINLNQFYFDLAKCYFNKGNYSKAFTFFNEIYQNLNIKGHTFDFYSHSRLLFCLCCYELGEKELMFYAAKATNEFLKRNKLFFAFEKRILKFMMMDLPKSNDVKEPEIKVFRQFQSNLETILESEFERSVLNYFDYRKWISAKIEQLILTADNQHFKK